MKNGAIYQTYYLKKKSDVSNFCVHPKHKIKKYNSDGFSLFDLA